MSQTPNGPVPPQDEPERPAAAGAVPPPSGVPGAVPLPPAPPAVGGYPPPQQPPAAYPPPPAVDPAGGYPPPVGAYPPAFGAYPPPAYGSAAQPVDAGAGFSWGWTKLWQTPAPFILATLIYYAVIVVVVGVLYVALIAGALASTGTDADGTTTPSGLGALFGVGGFVTLAIVVVLSYLVQAAMVRGALEVTYGRPVTLRTFFSFPDLGRVLGAALVTGLIVGVGTALCYLPGLFAAFFLQFVLYFVIDKQMGLGASLRASAGLARANAGPAALLLLLVLVAQAVGSALCGVGVLVAMPLTYLMTGYVYRRLLNEPVAP